MADKEKLSALMDGEAIEPSLIASLTDDKKSSETWQNFHLVGDVMRGDAPECKEWNIADSVALALENEPAHSVNKLESVDTFVEEQPTPQEVKRTLPTWLTQFGQVAIAACVSLAVIVGVQQYNGGEGELNPAEQLPVLNTIPFAGSVEPVSLTRDTVRHSASDEAQLMEQRRRINAMLQDYELQLRLNAQDGSINRELLEQELILAE
ncbi:anti-sigma E factor [Vibrio sp. Of7-15]|uniref:RseA family anti-sigma factor n=1 Tax=Vibrio sp. Of7-15 TaxID=2724879 RepID=UPI001EF307CF|nr:RseA family anti-sigma factor [Vibrio sp. Of7-15]MCG7499063.1 anti-sigma E factor [Vibrio sp. Of7-15]